MNTEQKRALLAKFCAPEYEIRHYLQHPIRQDGYLFATNGHILVRVEDDPAIDATTYGEPEARVPNCAALFEKAPNVPLAPLDVVLPEPAKCLACNGGGSVFKCSDCDGDGDFDHGNHTYECKECGGGGFSLDSNGDKVDCADCDGTGQNKSSAVEFHGTFFMHRYLELIQSLPSPELAINESREALARFRFAGGDGLLMPTRKSS